MIQSFKETSKLFICIHHFLFGRPKADYLCIQVKTCMGLPSFILNLCARLSPLLLCWVDLQSDPYTRLSQLKSWYSLPVATRGHNGFGPGDGRSGLITVTQQLCQLREKCWMSGLVSNDIESKLAISASLPRSEVVAWLYFSCTKFTMSRICSTSVTENENVAIKIKY